MLSVEIGGKAIPCGERIQTYLRVSKLSNGSNVCIPVIVINGTEHGPKILFSAGVHGNELEGTQAVWKISKMLHPKRLRGTFIGVPIANTLAYVARSRETPLDLTPWGRGNLNRAFPGNPWGSITERMAHVLTEQVISKVQYLVDFHSQGDRSFGVPYVGYRKYLGKNEDVYMRSRELAEIFGLEIVSVDETNERGTIDEESPIRGSPYIYTEMPGVGSGIDSLNRSIELDVKGAINVMKHLGMLDGKPTPPKKIRYVQGLNEKGEFGFDTEPNIALRVKRPGWCTFRVNPGDEVIKNQKLAEINDVFGNMVETISAPYDGLVIRVASYPVVRLGDVPVLVRQIITRDQT